MANRYDDRADDDPSAMQPVDMGRTGMERATSEYLSPGEGRPLLLGMQDESIPAQGAGLLGLLGGGAQAPAGGSALMLPLLLAQMQQQNSPLGAFSNAYQNSLADFQGRARPAHTGMDPLKVMQFASTLANQQDIMQSRQDARQIAKAKLILADQADQRAAAAQTRRDSVAERQGLKPIIDDMIANGNEASKKYGWQHRSADLAKATGQGIPDDIIDDLSTQKLDHTKMKDIIGYAREGVPDETLAAVFKLPPDQLQWIKTIANSPEHARQLGLQEEKEDWERQKRGLAIQKAINDDVKLDLAQTREERLTGMMAATQQRQVLADERAQRNEVRADKRLENWERAFNQKIDTKDEKKRTTFQVMRDQIDQTEQVALAMSGKHFLPEGSGWFATQKANLTRAMSPSDASIAAFQKVLQGGGVGFERSVMQDIGPRALAAYKGILSFYDQPPTLAAIQSATARMRRLIDVAESGQLPQREQIVYQLLDPGTRQKKTFRADWSPGFNLPPGAKLLMVGDERVD